MNSESTMGGMVRHERNDCTVAALSHAASIAYELAHAIAASAGRRVGGRANAPRVIERAKLYGLTIHKVRMGSKTLRKFLRFRPVGRFVVVKRGHMLSVIDGVPGDKTPLGSIITDAWEVRDA